jgi:hypothetical protein
MFTTKRLFIYMILLVLPIMSCKDNGTGTDPEPPQEQPASVMAQDQGTSNGNMVTIAEAEVDAQSWVVIHRSTEDGGPVVPDIIGKAALEEGTNTDVAIQLEEGVADGEQLHAMLHEDTGEEGEYEFTGSDSPDQPITEDEEVVMDPFSISQTDPAVTANDQVNKSNEGGTFAVNVDAAEDGWVVLHRSNSAGDGPQVPAIIGKANIYTGTNGDVSVVLNDAEEISSGEKLWAMLHIDSNNNGSYDFDAGDSAPEDPPVTDGNGDIVMVQLTVN